MLQQSRRPLDWSFVVDLCSQLLFQKRALGLPRAFVFLATLD